MKNIIKIIVLVIALGVLIFSIIHTRNNIIEKEIAEREEAEKYYEPISEEEELEDSVISYEYPEEEEANTETTETENTETEVQ